MARPHVDKFRKVDYEYADLGSLPIPLDVNTGLFTSPFVQLVGGMDSDKAVMPFKIDSTGRLDVIGTCPEHQADAYLNQANPASGTKYTVLGTTAYVRMVSVVASTTWTVQPNPLEVHLDIDGESYTMSQGNPGNNTNYALSNGMTTDTPLHFFTTFYSREQPFILEGRSIKLDAEVTGGTVSALKCRLKYAKW